MDLRKDFFLKCEEVKEKIKEEIRNNKTLVHCITNVVTVNDCANIILAVGGLATMAHHKMEVYEITSHSDALVCNMGATEYIEEMFISCESANANGIPIVLDPVGISASSYRRKKFIELIKKYKPTCIKGNKAEIISLFYDKSVARGVDIDDYSDNDNDNDVKVSEDELEEMAKILADKYSTIIVVSGETDLVTNGSEVVYLSGGSHMMTRITGAGCMMAAVIGVFLGNKSSMEAVVSACIYMNEAAKKAEEMTIVKDGGSGTFKMYLMDNMFNSSAMQKTKYK